MQRETGQRLGVVFLFLQVLLKTMQRNLQQLFHCFQPLAPGAVTQVKSSGGPQAPSAHGHTG